MFDFGGKANLSNYLLIGFSAVVTLLAIYFVTQFIEERSQ